MVYLMQFYKWTMNISDFLFSVCIHQKIFYLLISKLNCYSYFILSTLNNFLTWNSTSRWRKGRQLSLNLYTKKLFNFYRFFFCPKKTHNLFKINACDFFLLYDHVNINVNVNININACRLWGTGYGFLIVRGIPMFVALVICPQIYIATNVYCLTESIMIHVHDISEILWDTQHRRTYHIVFCSWAISVLRLASVFHLNGGEMFSETETVAWNIHSYFINYQNHLFDIVTKVTEKMSELWKLSLLTDRQTNKWTMNTQIHIYINKGDF